jgi:hypothetical protein
MTKEPFTIKLCLSVMMACSLVILSAWLLLSIGYDVSGRLLDSKGNELGFNNPITLELAIGLVNAALTRSTFHEWNANSYTLLCGFIQLVTILLIWLPHVRQKWITSWLGIQSLFFCPGILGLIIWPTFLIGFDGECVSELPKIIIASTPWLLLTWISLLLIKRTKTPSAPHLG